jgi:hypothetical protein
MQISSKGQEYSRCGLSQVDHRFPKYPRVPVLACIGFERKDERVISDVSEPIDGSKA